MGKKGKAPKAPAAPDLIGAAKQQGQENQNAAILNSQLNNVNQTTPFGSLNYTFDPTTKRWSSTTTLSPEQQALYGSQVGTQQDIANSVRSGFPGAIQNAQDVANQAPLNYSSPGSLDYSSLGGLPTAGDYAGRAKDVGDALYAQQTQYLDPQFQREQAAEQTRLANQGLDPQSEAYKNAMADFNANKNQAYQGARNAAIAASGAEQSRLTGDVLAGRAQGASELGNTALYGLNNANQTFQNQLASRQNQQTGAQTALGNLQSLYGMASPVTPSFQTGGTGANAQPADLLGATQAQYGNALDLYNAKAAQNSGKKGNATNLAGAGINALGSIFSDRRLKFDVEKIGTSTSGLPWYSYKKFGRPEVGVMADEVRTLHPEAVTRHESGFDMVDYDKLPGTVEIE